MFFKATTLSSRPFISYSIDIGFPRDPHKIHALLSPSLAVTFGDTFTYNDCFTEFFFDW
jgi:hypothetical protein